MSEVSSGIESAGDKVMRFLQKKFPEKYKECVKAGCARVGVMGLGSGSTIIECRVHKYKEIFYTG